MVCLSVIMGSETDYSVMKEAVIILDDLGIKHEVRVISAHRTPDKLYDFASSAVERGLKAIIAGAGGAAHLPGMVASMTAVPVLGVPIEVSSLGGLDSLLSIVQMPYGVPVATFAIGVNGAKNAALFAASIIGNYDKVIFESFVKWRKRQSAMVKEFIDSQ